MSDRKQFEVWRDWLSPPEDESDNEGCLSGEYETREEAETARNRLRDQGIRAWIEEVGIAA